MKLFINDEKFKLEFKQACLQDRELLLKELSSVFTLSELHFSKAVLNRYFKKYPNISFDVNNANKILLNFLGSGSLFITDFSKPFAGGYEKLTITKPLNDDELTRDPKVLKEINNNWYSFVAQLKTSFWHDNINYSRFLSVGDFTFFVDRPPESIREKNLLLNQKIEIDGVVKKIEYKFFNYPEVFKFYDQLINMFYPDFILLPKVSNKKIRRYGKHLSDDIHLCIYIDYSVLEKELKLGYLELPHIKVELLSSELTSCIKETLYLTNQDQYPIARIDLNYFMGNPISFRIGNSSEDENILKRDLFFYTQVYSFYLHKYLNFIEKQLIVCSNA